MPYIPVTYPIPEDTPGTVRLQLDASVQITEQRGATSVTRPVPGHILFLDLVNRIRPGAMGESDIGEAAPDGYAAEVYDGGRATVLWPVRDQEALDRVVRFIPHDQETQQLFEEVRARLEPTGVLA